MKVSSCLLAIMLLIWSLTVIDKTWGATDAVQDNVEVSHVGVRELLRMDKREKRGLLGFMGKWALKLFHFATEHGELIERFFDLFSDGHDPDHE